jgi:cell division protein ZapA
MVATHVNAKRKVEVLLMGQRFTVRSDRDDKYIEGLSRIVNEQLEDIKNNARTVSSHHIALLAALNIADELARMREKVAQLEAMQAAMAKKAQATLNEVETALNFLPPQLRGSDEPVGSAHEASAAIHDASKMP